MTNWLKLQGMHESLQQTYTRPSRECQEDYPYHESLTEGIIRNCKIHHNRKSVVRTGLLQLRKGNMDRNIPTHHHKTTKIPVTHKPNRTVVHKL